MERGGKEDVKLKPKQEFAKNRLLHSLRRQVVMQDRGMER